VSSPPSRVPMHGGGGCIYVHTCACVFALPPVEAALQLGSEPCISTLVKQQHTCVCTCAPCMACRAKSTSGGTQRTMDDSYPAFGSDLNHLPTKGCRARCGGTGGRGGLGWDRGGEGWA
jgi:hypothetical protein